ncbi:MAG TPA: hypothetical protein VM186_00795 [Planctomycetota bacterium]|nr:hypothetical protein [Planctomycetota bacterium]
MGTLSIDDLEGHPRSHATTQTEGSSGVGYDALVSGPVVVFGMKLAASAGGAASLTINDALTVAGGGKTIVLKANANRSQRFNFEPTGIRFSTGLSRAVAQAVDVGVINSQIIYVKE